MPAMRFPILKNLSLQRLISKLSVRSRIAAIAVIPVVGFLANGMTFTNGETEVENAFESVKSAAVLADTSRDFRAAMTRMQMASKDFVAQPSDEGVATFGAGHELALKSLNTIAAALDAMQRDEIGMTHQALGEMKLNFDALAHEQRDLRYNTAEGTPHLHDDSGSP